MEGTYRKLFSHLAQVEPRKGLSSRILARVNNLEHRQARVRTWAFSLGAITAFGGTIAAGSYVYTAIGQSGFVQYLALLFSGETVLRYWQELSLSLLDSLPVLGAAAFLAMLGLLVWATANAFSSARQLKLSI